MALLLISTFREIASTVLMAGYGSLALRDDICVDLDVDREVKTCTKKRAAQSKADKMSVPIRVK